MLKVIINFENTYINACIHSIVCVTFIQKIGKYYYRLSIMQAPTTVNQVEDT